MRTTLLLVAVVALTMSIVADKRRIAVLGPKLVAFHPLIRELEIDDPTQFAAIKMNDYWRRKDRWEVFLPEGRTYRLCVALEGVEDEKPTAPACTMPIASGRRTIDLEENLDDLDKDIRNAHRRWTLGVGPNRLTIEEPWDRHSHNGSGGGARFGISTQAPADRPLFLASLIYYRQGPSKMPTGPSDGFLLWIEPDPSRPR